MTNALPHFTAKTVTAIGTNIDSMLQQRVAAFQITYDEKKRIADPAKLVTELLHGCSDPHFHAVSHYQIGTAVYATKTMLSIEIVYLEDANQLNYVKQTVHQIISQIITPTMHLHQKIMAIHDWITSNVQYDHTLTRRTAYDGLLHKSTVCSGYASLFWHMCNAAAIPCRVVTGTGKFEAHAWNMVQLDAYWYHIDSTWSTVDDQHTPFSVYRFYLLNDKEMQRTHTVTLLPGQKPFPQANMQYREHLQQLGRTIPRLRHIIMQIQQKTGLAYLEPEYTVVGTAQLSKRLTTACQKRQTRVLFGYRGATVSAQHDIRDALNDIKAQVSHGIAVKVMMYPMPHGFTDDSVLIDVQITYT
ncbi:MAG: transglutaminase domain-containing protein [Roseiflexaceae bacterium]